MVYRNNTGRLGCWLHQCVLRNTLAGSKTVVSTSRNPTVRCFQVIQCCFNLLQLDSLRMLIIPQIETAQSWVISQIETACQCSTTSRRCVTVLGSLWGPKWPSRVVRPIARKNFWKKWLIHHDIYVNIITTQKIPQPQARSRQGVDCSRRRLSFISFFLIIKSR